MAMTLLDQIRQRVEAATKGPWFCEPRTTGTGLRYQHISSSPEAIADTYHHEAIEIQGAAISGTSSPRHGRLEDGKFISHSREDIPYLLELVAAADEMRDVLGSEFICTKEYARKVVAAYDALRGREAK